MAARPWYPGQVVTNGRFVLTEPLATWYPEFSVDLLPAEMIAGLAGRESLFVFTEEHAAQYVEVWGRALRQVFKRARKSPGRGDAILGTLQEAEHAEATRVTELDDLGGARLTLLPSCAISSTRTEDRPFDGIAVEGFDDDTLVLPERRLWLLDTEPRAWLPPAEKAWRAAASERHQVYVAAAERARKEQQGRVRWGGLLLLLLAVLAIGWFVNQLRKNAFLEPCREDEACRSGICRLPEGYCSRRCVDGCTDGTACTTDPRVGAGICVRPGDR